VRVVRDAGARRGYQPTVSVCVPSYNAVDFIGDAVRSVLHQSVPDLELIVVDDRSVDGTIDAVAAHSDPRLRIFENETNIGPAANWNRALGLARGRYVKVLCGDDLLLPGSVARQVSVLDRHPEVVLVAGRRDIVDATGRVVIAGRGLGELRGVVDGADAVKATVRSGTNLFGEPACVLLRGDAVARCGGFSTSRRYMLDVDYWCRMLRFGRLYAQDETVAAFRVSAASWSVALVRDQGAQAAELFRDLRRENDGITSYDLATGVVKARILGAGRALGYRALRLSQRFGTDPAPAPSSS